jgi:beta-barrel assembly-enhancing protease
LLRMDNEAQLAAVLAHEIGHFLQRHSLEGLRDAKSRSAVMLLLAPFGLVGAVGQLALAFGFYAYSRDQEREADEISIALLRDAGYDNAEASKVWGNLLAEITARPNANAAERSILFASHPPSEERREALTRMAGGGGVIGEQEFAEAIARHEPDLLEDELKRGQYEETIALLDRKITVAPHRASLRYARGEVYRLRAGDGDLNLALVDLRAAVEMKDAPAQTHRSLGLVLRKNGDKQGAAAAFDQYLTLQPEAPDSSIIKTYLSELK